MQGLDSMPVEVILKILESSDYTFYGEMRSSSKALSGKMLSYHVQYSIMERFLNAAVESNVSEGLDMALRDNLRFVLELFPRDTAIRMIASRLSRFGKNSRAIVELCMPFLLSLGEDEGEQFCSYVLSDHPPNSFDDLSELVPLILGGPDHLIGRIILSHIGIYDEETFTDWDGLFEAWPAVVEIIKSTGGKLMMAMYLAMRGLMSFDGGVTSADFPARNAEFIQSFAALRLFLGRAPLRVEMEGLVERIMPAGPAADLAPLAQLMASFCWVDGRGIFHGLGYLRYLFPVNVAECPDLAVPLSILSEQTKFDLGKLSAGQLKFLRLFDHSGCDIDQPTIEGHSLQCIDASTRPDTIRFICTEMYKTSHRHMTALYNAVHAALDFASPKKLHMFRSVNHRLAWSCLVTWLFRKQRVVVVSDTLREMVKEMHEAVEAGVNSELVHQYRTAVYETAEFRAALSDVLHLVSLETRQALQRFYHLSTVDN